MSTIMQTSDGVECILSSKIAAAAAAAAADGDNAVMVTMAWCTGS